MITFKYYSLLKCLKSMDPRLRSIKKEDLIRFILSREGISEDELIMLMSGQKETIPVSVFNAGLFPLEAITRYSREKLGKKISAIAKLLGKNASSISLAYKKSALKKFRFKEEGPFIPLSEFEKNPHLSVLENLVRYLKNNGLRFSEIARLLGRDVKTIWTVHSRAGKKSADNNPKK